MKGIRLDKYLADMSIGSRTEVKAFIKKGLIRVNEEICKKNDIKIIPEKDVVRYLEKEVIYKKHVYYMLNKPAGYVSATKDNLFPTVLDLIKEKRDGLFPVGRLDKDTEGFLMITNDGALAHRLLSPKNHVEKTYFVKVDGIVTQEDIKKFSDGVDIGEEKLTLPATLHIVSSDLQSQVLLTICEGKFHQVKRMFEAVDKHVLYLKRVSMGSIALDEKLKSGEYRPFTSQELKILNKKSKNTVG